MIWFILLGPALFFFGVFMRDGNMLPRDHVIGKVCFNVSLGLFILDLVIVLIGALVSMS